MCVCASVCVCMCIDIRAHEYVGKPMAITLKRK